MVEAPVCRRTDVSGWTRDDLLLLHIGLVVGSFGARAHLMHRRHLSFHWGQGSSIPAPLLSTRVRP